MILKRATNTKMSLVLLKKAKYYSKGSINISKSLEQEPKSLGKNIAEYQIDAWNFLTYFSF